jgi:alpha-L-fucosidase 2
VDMASVGEARLHLLPRAEAAEGWLAVAVATSSDEGGPAEEVRRVRAALADRPAAAMQQWADETRRDAAEFWAKSRVTLADPLLENLWYETLHARRATNRRGKTPPGLFLPSTVRDYSHWHGDYHTNYNVQEPFWGDYTANHPEIGDAYFDAVKFMLPVGRKIARDYYNCRGVFIQLSAYPIQAADDPLGIAPMGRMAYMTGWTANQYWWRYLYTLDEAWLRAEGYPVLRDCALFYTDFLKKGPDGLYHAFPSNQGEDGFSGNPKDYTDRPQVMQHARYCLRAAILASEVLKADEPLRAEWRDRLGHCAGDDGRPPLALEGLARQCYESNPPEFGFGRPLRPRPAAHDGRPWPASGDAAHTWYFGQYPWVVMQRLRGGEFIAERDLPVFRRLIERWRHPNGLIWGMAVADYGHAGAWTESLGVIAPLQEMMLQSWDGSLRIFPAWPRGLDARFENLRAEGAFLVTAAWSQGAVTALDVRSEKGAPCSLYVPWSGGMTVRDEAGQAVSAADQGSGRASFATRPGATYRLRPASSAAPAVPAKD